MVKVKCITNYNDLQLNKLVTTNDEPFEVTDERAKELEEKKLVQIVEVIPEKKEEKPKKKEAKKSKK